MAGNLGIFRDSFHDREAARAIEYSTVSQCLTDEEDQATLAEFMEFDRKMIHEKYAAVVADLEHR